MIWKDYLCITFTGLSTSVGSLPELVELSGLVEFGFVQVYSVRG